MCLTQLEGSGTAHSQPCSSPCRHVHLSTQPKHTVQSSGTYVACWMLPPNTPKQRPLMGASTTSVPDQTSSQCEGVARCDLNITHPPTNTTDQSVYRTSVQTAGQAQALLEPVGDPNTLSHTFFLQALTPQLCHERLSPGAGRVWDFRVQG